MLIKDIFSHKIHSSGEDWPLKLIEIASVFAQFDGQPFDRALIEESFKKISPRASVVAADVARDPSKYRDEISAYPAYLGLHYLELKNDQWILRLSETAKRFLIGEEPNVPAFMILQLCMFQFPNGKGTATVGKNLRIQSNARDKTLEFITNKIHLSPFRLICKALLADSIINGIDSLHPRISIDEFSILCNDSRINTTTSPDINILVDALKDIRDNKIPPIPGFEKRFHILNHTDLIEVTNGWVHLRPAYSPEDEAHIIQLLTMISDLDVQYDGFDAVTNSDELIKVIKDGTWSKFFDGVSQLPSELVQAIAGDVPINPFPSTQSVLDTDELIEDNKAIVFKYPLRERGAVQSVPIDKNYKTVAPADPEVTRIKRQKSNLQHKILLAQLDEHMRRLGATPRDNEHIDLYAEINNSNGFLFEVKSVHSENLLSQTRKGLSQLYEYRFRYSTDILENSTLCLVYPYEPNEIYWLQDYLCNDRKIAVIWFDKEKLCCPESCKSMLTDLNVA